MKPVVVLKRPEFVIVLDYEGLDFATVLESVEDHLGLSQGQRHRSEQMPEVCIWRAIEDDREAILDGPRLQLSGPTWFGSEARTFCTGFRTMAQMLPLSVVGTGVNPVFEARVTSCADLEEIISIGPRLAAASGMGLQVHELVWSAPMAAGGDARVRMRVQPDPLRVVLDCNWHIDHSGDPREPLDRWVSYEDQTQELAVYLTRAFAPL